MGSTLTRRSRGVGVDDYCEGVSRTGTPAEVVVAVETNVVHAHNGVEWYAVDSYGQGACRTGTVAGAVVVVEYKMTNPIGYLDRRSLSANEHSS